MSNAIKQSIRNLLSRYQAAATTVARHRIREQLLALPDQRLDDLGFDRKRLRQGLDAYPWTVAANDDGDPRQAA